MTQTVAIEELERHDFFPEDDLLLEPESKKASDDDDDDDDQVTAIVHSTTSQKEKETVRVSIWTEFVWLSKRDFRGIKRNPMTLGSRLALSSFMSILAGFIFWQVGGKETDDPIVSQVQVQIS